jgi:hypothetical protein
VLIGWDALFAVFGGSGRGLGGYTSDSTASPAAILNWSRHGVMKWNASQSKPKPQGIQLKLQCSVCGPQNAATTMIDFIQRTAKIGHGHLAADRIALLPTVDV